MLSLRPPLTRCAALAALIGLLASPTLAQPSAQPAQPAKPPVAQPAKPPVAQPAKPPATQPAKPPGSATSKPTQDQIDKRLERVKQRAAARKKKRDERQRDTRRALRKRLARVLGGAPLTPAVTRELTLHGQRTAQLRRIRLVAATKGDYEAVVRADKALARENSRHDGWWRQLHKDRLAAQREEKVK